MAPPSHPPQPPQPPQPPRMHKDYAIGVICALAIEKAAIEAMLDERQPPLKPIQSDDNSYTLGRIGNHNVVAACFPAGVTGNKLCCGGRKGHAAQLSDQDQSHGRRWRRSVELERGCPCS